VRHLFASPVISLYDPGTVQSCDTCSLPQSFLYTILVLCNRVVLLCNWDNAQSQCIVPTILTSLLLLLMSSSFRTRRDIHPDADGCR
jgi:hypothetical protein